MICLGKNRLLLKNDSEELLSEEAGGKPYVCNYNESDVFPGNHIPWHWHDWVEFNYTERGTYRLLTPDHSLDIRQGEAVYINRNVLHSYDFPEKGGYYSLTCDTRFLAGEHGSYLDQNYFSPVFRSRALSVFHICPNTAERIRMIECMLSVIDCLREEPKGYELIVREKVSRFLMYLQDEAYELLSQEKTGNERDMERMKLMLNYIYEHYAEPIELYEIAGAAGVSTRECTRCFQRSIHRPPIRFLIEYRAQMAAVRLCETSDSIAMVAEQCGFVSDSYFGKIFRDLYGCTPREYRKDSNKM